MTLRPPVLFVTFGLTLACGLATALAEAPPHVMLNAGEIQWGAPPPSLPPGVQLAVLYGDPGKPAPFVLRLRMPPGYKIPAHWHPTDENITVINGALWMGMGDKLDATRSKAHGPGGFMSMPAKTNHFAMAKEETVVEVSAVGPFVINYVNPADDPSPKIEVFHREVSLGSRLRRRAAAP